MIKIVREREREKDRDFFMCQKLCQSGCPV